MPCWRMPVVSKEQECLQWTALAGMLGICLIVSRSPITGLFFFLFFYMHVLVGSVFVGKYGKLREDTSPLVDTQRDKERCLGDT